MSDIPAGWTWLKVHQLAAPVPNALTIGPFGSNLKVADYRDVGVPLVFVRDIRAERFGESNTKYVSREKARELASHTVRPGDLLLTKMGEPPGDTAVYPITRPPAIITADCIKLSPNPDLTESVFLKHWFRAHAMRSQIIDKTMGVAQQKLSLRRFREIDVPLPPLVEQRRIVGKVEDLLAHVDAARERLGRVAAILKRFRQAVLAAACDGRLTKDWREETGRDGASPVRKLSELGSVSGGVTKNSTRNHMRLQVPYLRVANVYANRLKLAEVLKIGVTEQEFERTHLERNDLLFVEGNGSLDQIGRVAVWDGSITRCVHQNHLIKFRADRDVVPAYVLYQMMSPEGRAQLVEKSSSSAGLNTLSISKISDVSLPVPSLSEQKEIVRRVEGLLAIADKLEAGVAQANRPVERLTGSILSRAFRGELVPTEAELARADGREYESAEVLLERISSQRIQAADDATVSGKRPKRRSRPSPPSG